MMFCRNTIAILGVDGSGKSTAVENVSKRYGDKCTVTYMGYTRFEDPKIQMLEGKRFSTPLIEYRIYRCFWKRYFNGVKSGKISIFDRYVHEVFINAGKGKYDVLRGILYKYFFPKPAKIVYLYCSVEESLKRKNDITDSDLFRAMKQRFDDYFINRQGVLCLNTETLSPEAITDAICCFIDNSFSA